MCLPQSIVLFLIVASVALVNGEDVFHSNPENALNVPQLLLPYTATGCVPAHFILKALRGCFTWTSGDPEVATVTPVTETCNGTPEELEDESACSLSAKVKVTSTHRGKQKVVILAEDKDHGRILRCDVFVDVIDHIAIKTTAKELLIDESPEVFEILAYDSAGNIFTVLGGLKFEWAITPLQRISGDENSVLRMLWFKDSVYETSREVMQLERQKLRGSEVLIEGASTGEANVTAELSHPDYQDVISTVTVTVHDNVILQPPLRYILQHMTVAYSAYRLRKGAQQRITLPSPQYRIGVVDANIGQVDDITVTVRGLSVGSTTVQLIDTNTANLSSARQPTAILRVVDGVNIGFSINPGKRWTLEVGRTYQIHVLLSTDDKQRVTIDDTVMFTSILLDEYFDIHEKSLNQSYFVCTAKKVGKTLLQSTLDGVKHGEELRDITKVSGEQEIVIYDPVSVVPKHVLLPWEPSGQAIYEYNIIASGGSGRYVWTSLEQNVAEVRQTGIVSVGRAVGKASIKVADGNNPSHYALSTVTVLKPTLLDFVDCKVEALVGEILRLRVKVGAEVAGVGDIAYFDDCRKMVFDLTFSDTSVFGGMPSDGEAVDEGCRSISLKALAVGHTKLVVTYSYADVVLTKSVVIGAYSPVHVIDPSSFSLVSLGSTKQIVAQAGPLPWVLDTSQFHHIMTAEEDSWVNIHRVEPLDATKSQHIFIVSCTKLGEQALTISVFNKATGSNRCPAESSTTTKFVCTHPSSMTLVPLITLPTIDGVTRTVESCSDVNKRIPVLNNRELGVKALVYDSNGNVFDNASSLSINWSSDDSRVAHIARSNTGVKISGVIVRNIHIELVNLPATITTTIPPIDSGGETVNASLFLMAVPRPVISPKSLHMALHPLNKAVLSVTGGTKEFVIKNEGFTESTLALSDGGIKVVPITEGADRIHLYDSCLEMMEPVEAVVSSGPVSVVELLTTDKVQVGETIESSCTAFDGDGELLAVSEKALAAIDLQLKSSLAIVEMEKETGGEISRINYHVTGKHVGDTTLTCHAVLPSGVITSKFKDLQVFSPLQLLPKHLVLIVGSTYQIHSKGGPRPQSNSEYSCRNETILTVDSLGLVSTKNIGQTTVVGQAKHGDTVYSQDETIIDVIPLKGFKIRFNSRNLIADSDVGILSVGLNDESPFTFATSVPYLKFIWTSSDEKVVEIKSFHGHAGVGIEADNDFFAVVHTHSPGRATIGLKVHVSSSDHSQIVENALLVDEIQVQVFEKLQILYPSSGNLLLPIGSDAKIRTNKDNVVDVVYKVLPSSCGTEDGFVSVSDKGQLTALSSGISVVEVISRELGFNQSVAVQVEVKPVASVTLVSQSSFVVTTGTDHPSFPIGSTAKLLVALHDDMARKFDVSKVSLLHDMTCSHIAKVTPDTDEASYTVACNNIGNVILKVWLKEDTSIYTSVRIAVAHGIVPSQPVLSLGGAFCFKSANTVPDSGTWSVDNSDILAVDANTGGVLATAVGTTMVRYQSGAHATYTSVEVTEPQEAPAFNVDENTLLSNAQAEHLFPLRSNDGPCFQAAVDKVPFHCVASWADKDIPITDLFKVDGMYVDGQFACLMTTLPLELTSEQVYERDVILYVKFSENVRSQNANIKFIPKFIIRTDEIVFEEEDLQLDVAVAGSLSDLSALVITSPSDDLYIGPVVNGQFRVALNNTFSNDVNTSITLYSPSTKHSSTISVLIKGENPPPPPPVPEIIPKTEATQTWFFLTSEWMLVVLVNFIAIFIILIIFLFPYYLKKKEPVQRVLVPGTPYTNGRAAVAAPSPFTPTLSPYQQRDAQARRQTSPHGTLFSVSQ